MEIDHPGETPAGVKEGKAKVETPLETEDRPNLREATISSSTLLPLSTGGCSGKCFEKKRSENGWDEKRPYSARTAPTSQGGAATDGSCYTARKAVGCVKGIRGDSCRCRAVMLQKGQRPRAATPRVGQQLVQVFAACVLPLETTCGTCECTDSKRRKSS